MCKWESIILLVILSDDDVVVVDADVVDVVNEDEDPATKAERTVLGMEDRTIKDDRRILYFGGILRFI